MPSAFSGSSIRSYFKDLLKDPNSRPVESAHDAGDLPRDYSETAVAKAVNPAYGSIGMGVDSDPSDIRKESKTLQSILMYLGRSTPVWMGQNYAAYAREGYGMNSYVYRAISLVAGQAAQVPWVLFAKKRNGELEKIKKHPVLDLLENPCPDEMGWGGFMAKWMSYYLISGNAFLERVGPSLEYDRDPPKEFYPLRPDRMKIMPGTPEDRIGGYAYHVRGGSDGMNVPSGGGVPFLPEQILHFRTFHPYDDWYGMSPMSPLARSIDAVNEAKAWNVATLQNGGRPSGVFALKENVYLTQDELTSLRATIKEAYSGSKNAHKPLIIEAELDYIQTALTPSELDWLNGQKMGAAEIAYAYGVPPELMVYADGTLAPDMMAAVRVLALTTVIPMLEGVFRPGINRFMVAPYGKELRLDLDYDRIPALSEDRKTTWEYVKSATFMTENEKREKLGMDPKSWGDVRVFPASMVEVDEQGNATLALPVAGVGGQGPTGGDPAKPPEAAGGGGRAYTGRRAGSKPASTTKKGEFGEDNEADADTVPEDVNYAVRFDELKKRLGETNDS